ncbi:MAG: hemerythrin domain-containing protein [Rubrivivax sp.]|nr:hemerythrin domain-containing protein [Rubrivivax sp.]
MNAADPAGVASAAPDDALSLLREDHRRLEALLVDCEQAAADTTATSSADRSGLVARLGALLVAHGQVEDELVYPELDEAAAAKGRADHDEIGTLLKALVEDGQDAHGEFGSKLSPLAARLRAHVALEEQQWFAALSGLRDEPGLSQQLASRRAELLGPQGVD